MSLTRSTDPTETATRLLDAAAAHLNTPEARARLARLAARQRGETPAIAGETLSAADGFANAMEEMSRAFTSLAERAAYMAEEARRSTCDGA